MAESDQVYQTLLKLQGYSREHKARLEDVVRRLDLINGSIMSQDRRISRLEMVRGAVSFFVGSFVALVGLGIAVVTVLLNS